MADKQLRVAFIGAGWIARTHAPGIKKVGGAEIVGCMDIVEAKAQSFAAEHGGKPFTDAAAMLDALSPDAVWVCIPPCAHGVENMLAERKVPFLVEKPIHLDLAAARAIARKVARAGIVTGAGYMSRHRRGVQRVKELLATDPPVLMYGGWVGDMPGVAWWRVREQSGGQLLEQTTHTVDLVRMLAGEAAEVCAYPARGFIKGVAHYNVDDASVVVIRMKSGAVVNLMSCCANRSGGGGVSLTIVCRDMMATFRGWELSLEITKSALEKEVIAGEQNIFEIEDRAFLAAVRSGDPSAFPCPYEEGVKSLALCLAANESMRTGKPVKV
jgi:predicted dehydrogenase